MLRCILKWEGEMKKGKMAACVFLAIVAVLLLLRLLATFGGVVVVAICELSWTPMQYFSVAGGTICLLILAGFSVAYFIKSRRLNK